MAGVIQENVKPETLKRRAALKRYYEKNKAICAERARRYKAQNKEAVRSRNKAWNQRNKERIAEYNRRSRERNKDRRRLYGLLSQPGAEALLSARNDGCVYCGTHEELTLDHKHPSSKGGAHAIQNLQWLCLKCNRAKGDQSEDEFFAHVEGIYLKRFGPGL